MSAYQRNQQNYRQSLSNILDFNFFPVTLDKDKIKVFMMKYNNETPFATFKTSLPENWRCWRDTRDASNIYLWAIKKSPCPKYDGLSEEEVDLPSNPSFVCRLIMDGLRDDLLQKGFTQILGNKVNTFVNFSKGNQLEKIMGNSFDPRVGIYPEITADTFFSSFKDFGLTFGFVFDINLHYKLDIPVSELIAKGMECRGFYVKLISGVKGNPELSQYVGRTIGAISEINADNIVLVDYKDKALQSVDAKLCTIEPSWINLDRYFESIHSADAVRIKNTLKIKLDNLNSPKGKYDLIKILHEKFSINGTPVSIKILEDLEFKFTSKYQPSMGANHFPFRRLNPPTFNHDYDSSKTSKKADDGLSQYGPYDRGRFSQKKLNIIFISPDEHKGYVEKFIKKFQNGFSDTYQGFSKKYWIDNVVFTDLYFPLTTTPVKDYENALLKLCGQANAIDLCFLVITNEFKKYSTTDNPYYTGKAFLLSQGIPVQEITVEKMREEDSRLKYICNNIALSCYAKIGGIPFVLRAEELVRKELVIGIGSAIVKDSRLSSAEKIIGFTTIFKNNGDFVFNSCTPCVNFIDYENALEENIVQSINSVSEKEGYKEGDELRIIFHVYKRTGRHETNAINRALKRLSEYKIEFALLHINDSHNFRMFDCTNTQDKNPLSHYVPQRGISIEMGPRERLVNFIGPYQYKNKGCPVPLRITLDKSSSFKDIDYLTQQTYHFSFISWRGFHPSIRPVTIFYSSLIAELNGKLSKVNNWNQNMIKTRLYDKMWFL